MKEMAGLDAYRHKLVEKILRAESFEQIKRFIITALRSLRKHEVNEHLIGRFLDKAIDQLQGVTLMDVDVQCQLNARYAKSQLELIKRHAEERKVNHV